MAKVFLLLFSFFVLIVFLSGCSPGVAEDMGHVSVWVCEPVGGVGDVNCLDGSDVVFVSGASVLLEGPGRDARQGTTSGGLASLDVVPGTYTVTVTTTGYSDVNETNVVVPLYVVAGDSVILSFELDSDSGGNFFENGPVVGYYFNSKDISGNVEFEMVELYGSSGKLYVYTAENGFWESKEAEVLIGDLDRSESDGLWCKDIDSDGFVDSVNECGFLPENFVPRVGYFFPPNSVTWGQNIDDRGSVNLFGASGGAEKAMVYNVQNEIWFDWTSSILSETSDLPENFNAILGYYFPNASVGRVHLFGELDSVLKIFIFNPGSNTWFDRTESTSSQFPGGIFNSATPVSGYYSQGTNKVTIFWNDGRLIETTVGDWVWDFGSLEFDGVAPATLIPDVAYYDEIVNKDVLWFEGMVYTRSNSSTTGKFEWDPEYFPIDWVTGEDLVKSGEDFAFGSYTEFGEYGVCGDDSDEFLIEGEDINSCCNNSNSFILSNGECFLSGYNNKTTVIVTVFNDLDSVEGAFIEIFDYNVLNDEIVGDVLFSGYTDFDGNWSVVVDFPSTFWLKVWIGAEEVASESLLIVDSSPIEKNILFIESNEVEFDAHFSGKVLSGEQQAFGSFERFAQLVSLGECGDDVDSSGDPVEFLVVGSDGLNYCCAFPNSIVNEHGGCVQNDGRESNKYLKMVLEITYQGLYDCSPSIHVDSVITSTVKDSVDNQTTGYRAVLEGTDFEYYFDLVDPVVRVNILSSYGLPSKTLIFPCFDSATAIKVFDESGVEICNKNITNCCSKTSTGAC